MYQYKHLSGFRFKKNIYKTLVYIDILHKFQYFNMIKLLYLALSYVLSKW